MRLLHLLLLVALALSVSACLEDKCEQTVIYHAYDAVTITADEWRGVALEKTAAVEICEPSGFYVYGDYLFTVDQNLGLQIIDNKDNDNPVSLSFLSIPGAQGIAVRNDILYVSQYLDLLAFDLSDPEEPSLLSRTNDVFSVSDVFIGATAEDKFVTAYVLREETMEVSCDDPYYGKGALWDNQIFFSTNASLAERSNIGNTDAPDVVGQGGSLARFTISNATLYTVDDNSLRTFSLAKPEQPEFVGTTDLGWGIETIFPYKDQLYIGSTTGMHIYDASDPLAPKWLSTFQHVELCDPVVVQNDIAYVTMWGGNDCGRRTDQLSVIDVSDPSKPVEMQNTELKNSHGLGVSGNRLFLCAGQEGLKVYDLTDEGLLGKLVSATEGFDAKDVIFRPDRSELIVFGWGQAGIRQYDYLEGVGLTAVSDLAICR